MVPHSRSLHSKILSNLPLKCYFWEMGKVVIIVAKNITFIVQKPVLTSIFLSRSFTVFHWGSVLVQTLPFWDPWWKLAKIFSPSSSNNIKEVGDSKQPSQNQIGTIVTHYVDSPDNMKTFHNQSVQPGCTCFISTRTQFYLITCRKRNFQERNDIETKKCT